MIITEVGAFFNIMHSGSFVNSINDRAAVFDCIDSAGVPNKIGSACMFSVSAT